MTVQIFEGLRRADVLEAARALDEGVTHRFGESKRYDVIVEGRRYPPKATLGIAVERAGLGHLGPGDFKGGLGSACFRALEACGFEILSKPGSDTEPDDSSGAEGPAARGASMSRDGPHRFPLRRDDGSVLDATLGTGVVGDVFGLVIEAHGDGRNADYQEAVELALERLRHAGCRHVQVRLVSGPARTGGARSGHLLGYPEGAGTWLGLEGRTPRDLREAIGQAVRRVRTTPAAKGSGNGRKRILIDAALEARSWREILCGPGDPDSGTEPDFPGGRERVLASITARRGQRAFRQALLRAYGGRCAVTETSAEAVLEAAHIRPYDGPATNCTSNGLLLRADIHTLFDLDLLRIGPDGRVTVDAILREATYRDLDGRTIRYPEQRGDRPDPTALASRARR